MEQQNNQLEEMRQQLDILKGKLSDQQIVTNTMIRKAMLNKMSFMKKYTWMSYFALAFIYLSFYFLRAVLDLSWWLYGFTCFFMTVDILCDYYINRYTSDEFLNDNLLETREHMVKQHKLRRLVILSGMVFLMVWMPWFFYEMYQGIIVTGSDHNLFFFQIMAVGSNIGGIVGLIVGLSIYFKMQRINKEIIAQIDELKKGE